MWHLILDCLEVWVSYGKCVLTLVFYKKKQKLLQTAEYKMPVLIDAETTDYETHQVRYS